MKYTDGTQLINIQDDCRGIRLWANGLCYVFVNQGWRLAHVIDKRGADLLIQYEMPNGKQYLQEWTATLDGSYRFRKSVNRKRLPTKWFFAEFP